MPKLLYQCKYCGTTHNTEADAINCEVLGKPEPRWPIGQTFRSQYTNIAKEIIARDLVLYEVIHSWQYQVKLGNGYVTTMHENEITDELTDGALAENHPRPNDLTNVYYCAICGREHNTEQSAITCEDMGMPTFKYDIGWNMEEYDGDFVAHIVARRINFDRGDHVIEYGMQYLGGFEGATELPEGAVSEWVPERRISQAIERDYY